MSKEIFGHPLWGWLATGVIVFFAGYVLVAAFVAANDTDRGIFLFVAGLCIGFWYGRLNSQ